MLWVGLQSVIVAFPGHTHFLFGMRVHKRHGKEKVDKQKSVGSICKI